MFKQKSQVKQNRAYNLPAPAGGLDAISSIMSMRENACVLMENWFPTSDGIRMRDGNVLHVTGFTTPVNRMHVYAAANGGEKLFATTVSGVYDATTAGAVGAAVIGLTNGFTISTIIATGASNYLLMANGVDTMKQFDGTTWSSIASFGVTGTSAFNYVETYRQRLFLVEKNSLNLHYLSINSIAGAATVYPLGAIFRKGGTIIAMGTWTIDGGSGPEDQLAVITSKGEVAVFAGSDPSSASTWATRGVYAIGVPLGANCMYKYGGDLLIITEDGLYPLSSAVQSAAIEKTASVSEKIRPIFNTAAALYGNNAGWQVISDPSIPMLLVNVPSTPVKKQFVMNSQSQAWTTFSGWDATCFARLNRNLYFGTANSVCQVTGFSDQGANIRATLLQAYTRLGVQQNKKVELTKPYLQANGGFRYNIGYATDFAAIKDINTVQPYGDITAALWGTGIFGQALWTGITTITQDWQATPDDYSLWKAFYLQCVSNNAKIRYYGSDLLYIPGGHF